MIVRLACRQARMVRFRREMNGNAPVAHLDRATASGAVGGGFEPRRVHHFLPSESGKPPQLSPLCAFLFRLLSFQNTLRVFTCRDKNEKGSGHGRHAFHSQENKEQAAGDAGASGRERKRSMPPHKSLRRTDRIRPADTELRGRRTEGFRTGSHPACADKGSRIRPIKLRSIDKKKK